MATQAQLDANRANAQKSTGPRTPEGRAAVRQNALKHGLTSMSPVAPGEDPAEFLLFLADWTQAYQPVGPAEDEVLRTAVVASWRLRRIPAIEAGYYEMEQASGQAASPAARLAFAHYHCARQLEALSCQESRLQRTFDKSLRELERLQARPSRGIKTGLENQTQFPTQPQENQSAGAAQSPFAQSNPSSESNPVTTQSGASDALDLENQTQFPTQSQESQPDAAQSPVAQPGCSSDSSHTPAQSGAAETGDLENQTQFPARSAESQASTGVAGEAATPELSLPTVASGAVPYTPTPEEVQAASDLIDRVFAQLPKTA